MLCTEWPAFVIVGIATPMLVLRYLDLDGIRINMYLVTFIGPICKQYCQSGSGIRCLFDPGIRDG
jgi:hypothetical protein